MLLVGLGNPGTAYAGNRHNVGFMVVDAIAAAYRFGPEKSRFHGLIREGLIGADKALIVKPQTYMNRSGISVAEAARFYKIPLADIVVVHDDIDLAPGKFKMKTGGGHGGHNGLRDLDAHLGPGYRRLRVGVGHPGDKALVERHVLSDFAKADQPWLDTLVAAIVREAEYLARGDDPGFVTALSRHLSLSAQKDEQ